MTMSSHSIQSCHDCEAKHDNQSPHYTRHAVLGQLVPGQHLKECDVEQCAPGHPLQDPNKQHVGPCLCLSMKSEQEPHHHPHGSHHTQHHHGGDDPGLPGATAHHLCPDTEDDGNAVNSNCQEELPHTTRCLLQPHCHPLKQAV